MKKTPKKQAITLLEVMIVIFLIGLIGGVISWNMRGSLDEGRAFKTEQAIKQVTDILEMEVAQLTDKKDIPKIRENKAKYLGHSGVVKSPDALLKDGWGNDLAVTITDDGVVTVASAELQKYKDSKESRLK